MLSQLVINLRLYFRNKMALLYGYLFPTFFLVAFLVRYRYEAVPLVRHLGELLTVTALGGACFGLPTALVNERERGVWRRYRLAPVSNLRLVAGTVLARYFLLISAALVQLLLALGFGMPVPDYLFNLWLSFSFVAFAFLGMGLLIAMVADTVPTVQALGQSIFLPMLIIGGVAVRLESLPVWAQHVAAFFPGQYAVDAIQVVVDGKGLGTASFSLLALFLSGVAGCLAGAKLFRWDARKRFVTRSGKGWIGVALAAWVVVGILAETTGRIGIAEFDTSGPYQSPTVTTSLGVLPETLVVVATASGMDTMYAENAPDVPAEAAVVIPAAPNTEASSVGGHAVVIDGTSGDAPGIPSRPASWKDVTMEDIERDLSFDDLPPDEGLVAPVATKNDRIAEGPAEQLLCVRQNLPFWGPGRVEDLEQRTRNFLYIAAVPDMFQYEELERWAPVAVFDHLQYLIPEDELSKILYWIVTHPDGGNVSASNQLPAVCLEMGGPSDVETLRERTTIYALKLLGRSIGKIEAQ